MKASVVQTNSIIFATVFALLTKACVTVNVNFPESAVQKAADNYVRELYDSKERSIEDNEEENGEEAKSSFLHRFALFRSAHAEVNIKLNSKQIKTIQKRQRKRVKEIDTQKENGRIGEGFDGYLSLRLSKSEEGKRLLVKKLKRLVDKENADRKDLYAQALKDNEFPSSRMMDVQRKFAEAFQKQSPRGTWVEASKGDWKKKGLKKSARKKRTL